MLSIGQQVHGKSSVATEIGSSVVISVADGSALKIDGRSEIAFGTEYVENLKRKISVSLLYGKLLFDVQKQAVKDEFEIRTENVSSIVRGTAGFIENVDGLEVSSLKEGRLDVVVKMDTVPSLKSGQTMIANANGVKVLSLSCSGSLILARAIDSIATEMAAEFGVPAAKLNLDKVEIRLHLGKTQIKFGFSLNLDKFLTLKNENIFPFSLLNRNFALILSTELTRFKDYG